MKNFLLMSAALLPLSLISPAMAEVGTFDFDELASIETAAGHGYGHAKGHEEKQHSEFVEALLGGQFDVSFRYRIEHVDSDAFAEKATAGTLQSLFGYRTGTYKNTSAYIQFRDVTTLGSDSFNDTINGKTSRPVIADPEATEIDQAYLDFKVNPDTRVTVGRRKLQWGNRRFVAALWWRQNHRSFDGIVVENKSLPNTELHYAYSNNVNRAFTDRSPNGNFDEGTNVHLLNARYSGLPIGKLTAYGYFLDLDGAAGADGVSSKTFGVNLTGKKSLDKFDVKYVAEYARQSDFGDNPTNYSADYFRIEPSVHYKGFSLTAGYEVLGSDDGNIGFSTPLALLHAYNGWADIFVNTPADGLEDAYIKAGYKWKSPGNFFTGGGVKLAYHDFQANEGGADFGTEFDAAVKVHFLDHYNAQIKYADFNSDGFSSDTQKIWFTIGAKF